MAHWWPWLAAVAATAVVLVGSLLTRSRRSARPAVVERVVTLPGRPVRWSPHHLPMGPVSGWPHEVDQPDAIPTGSPADRPDL